MKFKIGDRVKVVGEVKNVGKAKGELGVVEEIFGTGEYIVQLDREIKSDRGVSSDLWCVQESAMQLVKSADTITIHQRKNKIVAVTTNNGDYVKSANVKLAEFDGDFEKASKAVVSKLVDGKDTIEEIQPEIVIGELSYHIVKQDKYEVGDKVKVREDLKHISETADGTRVEEPMKELSGEIVKIAKDVKMNAPRYLVDDNEWFWTPEMFEGKVIEITIKEPDLTVDGFKVGDKVIFKEDRTGISTCGISARSIAPFIGRKLTVIEIEKCTNTNYIKVDEDSKRFSWNTKLFELATEPPLFDWESFKLGKFAVHCDTEEKAREFLKECDKQGVIWCSGDKTTRQETRWECYKDKTCYGYCTSDLRGISFGHFEDVKHIEYTSKQPTIKEVSRPAKVGEWIKVVAISQGHCPEAKIGDIHKTVRPGCSEGGRIVESGNGFSLDEYVVLENYTPEEPKPLLSSDVAPTETTMFICHEGEGGFTLDKLYEFKDGHCIDDDGDIRPLGGEIMTLAEFTREYSECLKPYVVEPKSFAKAKVGDKIEVVKDYLYHPSAQIGNTHHVNRVDDDGIFADDNSIYFWDKNEEYIIIESAPEDKFPIKTLSDYTQEQLITELFNRQSK